MPTAAAPQRDAGWCRANFSTLKHDQLTYLLVRQIAEAQFQRGDREHADRLWQEVAALDLDPERVTALLYGAADPRDRSELEALDQRLTASLKHRRWSWAPARWRVAVERRTAPPATAPAHPAVR